MGLSNEIDIQNNNLLEELAALEHVGWSRWMEHLFEKSIHNDDGTVTIPAWAVERWKRQVDTPYSELTDQEKESDRDEARKILDIIK